MFFAYVLKFKTKDDQQEKYVKDKKIESIKE
jgi:hypothetical protein